MEGHKCLSRLFSGNLPAMLLHRWCELISKTTILIHVTSCQAVEIKQILIFKFAGSETNFDIKRNKRKLELKFLVLMSMWLKVLLVIFSPLFLNRIPIRFLKQQKEIERLISFETISTFLKKFVKTY